ncbi:SDR family oxidoreductase [Pseudohongiella sp.]|uniref:3-oxoacyl-ACP reductase n=1 Tax=marine sediment metagenome TaxID=412755 RepID=A0A0F9W2H1_9ZZZZ|nr:SDR family oxidoreductase [Pseudohongiella sp.]HDZ09292.1 SDR family oxidoreductase [Pseudohongiella sp.]HEA62156.1 SDR family oxidoreductase [Pseudohongiella sp.]
MSTAQQSSLSVGQLFGLAGKTALVTGGSSGLGFIMAETLLRAGVRVVIASRKQEKCDQALAQLQPLGDCRAIAADVTRADDRQRLCDDLRQHFEGLGLSILVNNAGANWGARIEEYPDDAFAKVMATNVNAVFSLTRDLLPLLEQAASAADPARVINIGSMDGLQVPIVQRVPTFAYSASKAALHHLTHTLAVDLGPRQITVNAVAPGFFQSRMTDYVLREFGDDIAADSPMGRAGEPEEIAGVLVYLASRAGAYTNGAVIPVDGGTHVSKGTRPWMTDA